ncbi:hypothetical protein CTRI78_v004359 [Colletotrichum trifolii]|uniref:Uncharacterized protein n=1 Tax=Colletotrichum trifolii TaxID=5466 RepID=A0A4R8RHJ4_COLTR|nr:hypothetical protein CTRI78_v004359 [Colletotrichum trifolii]
MTYQIVAQYPDHLSMPWVPQGQLQEQDLVGAAGRGPGGPARLARNWASVSRQGSRPRREVSCPAWQHGRNEQFNRMKESLELGIRSGTAKAVKDARLLLDIGITVEVLTDMDPTGRLDGTDFEG